MQLPDHMPEGSNFFGLIRTELEPAAVAQRFVAAGWKVSTSGGQELLEIAWGRLTLTGGAPMVMQGWLDRPDQRVGELLGHLGGRELTGEHQWINAAGQLWRELPFDESMLAPDGPRLPADIKASILASRAGSTPAPRPRKPWWRFW